MFRTILAVCGSSIVILLAASSAFAALVTIDQDTTIDAANSFPEPPMNELPLDLFVVNGPNGPSNVNLVDGGVIGGFVEVRDTSHLFLSGGEVQALTTVRNHATLTMTAGSIEALTRIYATITATSLLKVEDFGVVNLRGGTLGRDRIILLGSSTMNVYGHSFIVDGDLPTGTNPGAAVRVQGFFANNQPFNILFDRDPLTAQVFLHAVPEPSAMAMANVFVMAWFGAFAPKCQRCVCASLGSATLK